MTYKLIQYDLQTNTIWLTNQYNMAYKLIQYDLQNNTIYNCVFNTIAKFYMDK